MEKNISLAIIIVLIVTILFGSSAHAVPSPESVPAKNETDQNKDPEAVLGQGRTVPDTVRLWDLASDSFLTNLSEGKKIKDDDLFMRVSVGKNPIRIGEKTKLSFDIYTRYDTRYNGFKESPTLRGMWIEDIPIQERTSKVTRAENGKRYMRATVKEIYLTPIYGGDMVINPGSVKIIIRNKRIAAGPSLYTVRDDECLLNLSSLALHVENPTGKSKADLLSEYSNQRGPRISSGATKVDKPALIILLDISSSMLAEDMQPQNRLFSAKIAISKFLKTNDELMIGLKCFSENVIAVSPLTRSRDAVVKALEGVLPGLNVSDGTSIGDAVFEATKELSGYSGNKKSIILLTDGVNNSGHLDPLSSVDFASNEHITIHTIALGTKGLVPYPDPQDGNRKILTEVGTDEQTLAEMAKETGGRYGAAKNEMELESLLGEIRKTLV